MAKLKTDIRGQRGMTLIEILVVVVIMVMVIMAVAKLVHTTYISWITADRRIEIVETGRTGMSKLVREIRLAYDLFSATDTAYIDYYPQWSTDTYYRFNYDSAAVDFEHAVATPTFSGLSLAAPMDTFAYVTYDRRLNEGVTRARRINAFKYVFDISDERGILPSTRPGALNPITFRSQSHMRMSREGWQFARTLAFATETYAFRRNRNQQLCIKAYSDRVDPDNMTVRTASILWGAFGNFVMTLDYVATGEYFASCCVITNVGTTPNQCNLGTDPTTSVDITLNDGTEWTIIRDEIRVW